MDLSSGALTTELAVAGVVDQNGAPVGDNWEGLAWDAQGLFLYGTQDTTLYRLDPVSGDVVRVCANLGVPGAMVEALELTSDGRLVGSSNVDTQRTLIEIGFPEDEASFGANACTRLPITLPSGPLTNDLEGLAFESCDTVSFACSAGRGLGVLLGGSGNVACFDYTLEAFNDWGLESGTRLPAFPGRGSNRRNLVSSRWCLDKETSSIQSHCLRTGRLECLELHALHSPGRRQVHVAGNSDGCGSLVGNRRNRMSASGIGQRTCGKLRHRVSAR